MSLMGRGAAIEIADTLNNFSITVGIATSTNVYWDGSSQYLIKNTNAAGKAYRIFSLRLRASS